MYLEINLGVGTFKSKQLCSMTQLRCKLTVKQLIQMCLNMFALGGAVLRQGALQFTLKYADVVNM